MKKMLSKAMAAAVVAALFVGATLSATTPQSRRNDDRPGLMPEVVVRGEAPRLVMPTVVVRAHRAVAMTNSGDNVN